MITSTGRTIAVKFPPLNSREASLVFAFLNALCSNFFEAYDAEITADEPSDAPDDLDESDSGLNDADLPF
jgi:hypothetical protein